MKRNKAKNMQSLAWKKKKEKMILSVMKIEGNKMEFSSFILLSLKRKKLIKST